MENDGVLRVSGGGSIRLGGNATVQAIAGGPVQLPAVMDVDTGRTHQVFEAEGLLQAGARLTGDGELAKKPELLAEARARVGWYAGGIEAGVQFMDHVERASTATLAIGSAAGVACTYIVRRYLRKRHD